MYLSKHFLFSHDKVFIRPLGFGVLLSYFVFPRDFYTSQYIGRVVSFIFTYLSAVMLFILYRRLGLRVLYSKLFTFLFIFAPYNVYYSTLNKPESMAVFFILFFIYLLHRYVFDGEKKLFNWLILLIFFLPMIRFELFVMSFVFLILGILFKKKRFLLSILLILLSFSLIHSYFSFSLQDSIMGKNFREDFFKHMFSFKNAFKSISNNRILLLYWVLILSCFFCFIYVSIKRERSNRSSKSSKLFYYFLFYSFVLLSLLYFTYYFSSEMRYQKILYPFLFLSFLSIHFFDNKLSKINMKKFTLLFFLFLFVFFVYNLYDLQSTPVPFVLPDAAVKNLLINSKSCFNNTIFYTGITYLSFFNDINVVNIGRGMSAENVFLKEEEYKNISKYIYILDALSYHYSPLSKDRFEKEILFKYNTSQNYKKLKRLCPSLEDVTLNHIILLDKPLSKII